MADWQRVLNIADEWEQAQEYDISPQQLATVIAERLNNLQNFNDPLIDGIKSYLVMQFQLFSENEEADENYFNLLMRELYNWADISLDGKLGGKKVCWVKTL